MARTALNPTSITINGVAPTLAAANVDGIWIQNKGREYIHVLNGSGAPITVTVVTAKTAEGRAIADDTVTIPAGQARLIGPFRHNLHDNPAPDKGKVFINFSSVTTVTIAAFRLPDVD
jgi:hypothetical protein